MIVANGQAVMLEQEYSVKEYLCRENYHLHRIAVELNGAILPKAEYPTTILRDGDKLEIVSFVGGG